ncbi:MAG: M23 family peptidase, partial [Caulobacteraceae bacterium]|nr:M23 family peptidase [Caulobacteraceae bacterium]
HLHYEVFARGGRIDPRLARATAGQGSDRADQAAFRAQKARIDAMIGADASPGFEAG